MPSSRPSAAGGFLLSAAILVGTGVGLVLGEVTRGFLIGLAAGVGLALAVWWRGR
jgi:mannose/fructose/N-acetylgalactosamine-specific phosphotransferase system component IIC